MAFEKDTLGWIEYRDRTGNVVHQRLGYVSELETNDLGDMGSWFSKTFKPILSPLKVISKPLTKFYQRAIKPGVKMLVPGGAPPSPMVDIPTPEEHPISTIAPVVEKAPDYTMYYVIGGVAVVSLLAVLFLTGKKKEVKK